MKWERQRYFSYRAGCDADTHFKKSLSDEKPVASRRRSHLWLLYHLFKLSVFLFTNAGAYDGAAADDAWQHGTDCGGNLFYLPADIVPLAGEGAMKAVSDTTHIAFNKVKVGFDISMVIISLISCLVALGTLGSVGVGTIIAAVLVGSVLGVITGWFGEKRDKILKGTPSE